MFRLLFRLRSNSRLRHNDWTAIVRRLASFPLSTRWRRVPNNSSYRQILKTGSLGQRNRDAIRPTPKAWISRRQPLSSVGRIASLLIFGRFLAVTVFEVRARAVHVNRLELTKTHGNW